MKFGCFGGFWFAPARPATGPTMCLNGLESHFSFMFWFMFWVWVN